MEKNDISRIEFHRWAVALLPEEGDTEPGVAYYVETPGNSLSYDYCTCHASGSGNCTHMVHLQKIVLGLKKNKRLASLDHAFRNSIWDKLAVCLNDALRVPLDGVCIEAKEEPDGRNRLDFFYDNRHLLSCYSKAFENTMLLERLGSEEKAPGLCDRAKILGNLNRHTLSDTEKQMLEMGRRTRRQVLEGSFWYRVAYHCFFVFGFETSSSSLCASIDDTTGEFSFTTGRSRDYPRFVFHVPRTSVRSVSLGLKEFIENYSEFSISDKQLMSVLKMSMNQNQDLSMELYLRYSRSDGDDRVYPRKELQAFTYGDLIYLSDEKVFAEVEKPDPLLEKFKGKFKRTAKNKKIPALLDSMGDSMWGRSGKDIIDESVSDLKIYKNYDRIKISPESIDREWCWLSMEYAFGNSTVSLWDIYDARKSGKRFITTGDGWVDCRAVPVDQLASIPGMTLWEQLKEKNGSLKLSGADLFRIMAASEKPVEVAGGNDLSKRIEDMMEMKPSSPLPMLTGLNSVLRKYQVAGTRWLTFLYENNFSGILCDDMGLGKTHQVMALMVWLKEVKKVNAPFLVVAPVTVLSHWENKIREYAPILKTVTYYGLDRGLENGLAGGDVVLTSFGLLRRDIHKLSRITYAFAAFDEAQHLKNQQTQVYQSARVITADMKLAVTGTPIENTLSELKSLMDISFPGYLGTDEAFDARYVKPVMSDFNKERREELSRMVKPFTLRRLKTTVLDELPEKIEDIRTCRLSEDQIKLYRQAVSSKGKNYLETLQKADSQIPYIHIFALLTLLKQICDHPALVEKKLTDYEQFESGKWELFKELLSESLASGQKTVVFSQYTGMVSIIEQYLKTIGVDAAILTGASRNRGKIIDRFNNDPDCRVFVGSLLAGGTGIDLVAASVVIHYDRWWNAAKEDQATDRVHRIGQKRGVQVFKLVTQGTLEEKISLMIEKKRNLMDSVIREDDPDNLKTFTRDQLIELLTVPEE